MPAGRRRPRRRPELSQHFIRGAALAARLIESASIARSELVLEIGAGDGALTRPLQARARHVIAVEVDPSLAASLRSSFAHAGNVEVVEADIRSIAFPPQPVRVVGNVPYALTAEIVRRVTAAPSVVDAHLIVQREAAQKFAGSPWGPEGARSLALKPWWHIEIARPLRRTDFAPAPRVESALLWLARRSPALVRATERHEYLGFTRRALESASTMRATLNVLFTRPQVRRLAADLQLNLDAPPSATRFEQWLALYRFWRVTRERVPASPASARRRTSPRRPRT